jgi:hypothetical protein
VGKPHGRPAGPFERLDSDGVTVWKAQALEPLNPEKPLKVDLGKLPFRRRLVLRNAR